MISAFSKGPSVDLTRDSVLKDRVFEVFTHPLLAAFPRQPDMLWVGAVWGGQAADRGTSVHTGHPSTPAVAVGVAGGLKGLALHVGDPVDHAAQLLPTCGRTQHPGLRFGET